MLLRHARADYETRIIPGRRDLTEVVTYPMEVTHGKPTLTVEHEIQLRRNRYQFTAVEDNLLLRGVVSISLSISLADPMTCRFSFSGFSFFFRQ